MQVFRGMTLVDTIVGVAFILIVFVGLVGLLRASLSVSGIAKARAGATAIAESQMEYIRGLDYSAVGTVGGVPSGAIATSSSQSLNGITYKTRTIILYVDDAADGTAGSDTNGIITDYKRIKVEVSYTFHNVTKAVADISNLVPPGIETSAGGGTLTVAVVDASYSSQ